MINAHVEMNLNDHVSVIAGRIIQLIKAEEEIILEALLRKFMKMYIHYTPDQFMNGLAFLYSIDCLEVENYRVVLRNV